MIEKWNVPGNVDYSPEEPIDVVLRADADERLRGYWLEATEDGRLALVVSTEGADDVFLDYLEDGTPVIRVQGEPDEFFYDGNETIRVRRYS